MKTTMTTMIQQAFEEREKKKKINKKI